MCKQLIQGTVYDYFKILHAVGERFLETLNVTQFGLNSESSLTSPTEIL